jgi:hypothetical protein
VRVARGSGAREQRERGKGRSEQTPARGVLGELVEPVVFRHGEQRANGVTVVCALDPIDTVHVPPRPGVVAWLL